MPFDVAPATRGHDPLLSLCRAIRPYRNKRLEEQFDFRRLSFVDVGAACALATFMRWTRLKVGHTCHLQPNYGSDASRYLQRMDFYDVIGAKAPNEAFSRHDGSGRFLELTRIDPDDESGSNEVPARLRGILVGQRGVDLSAATAVENAFGEVIDNVAIHSKTPRKGLAAAQLYPSKNEIVFCVSDCGVGIPATMSRDPSRRGRDDTSLLAEAFEYRRGENVNGVLGHDDSEGCGWGLAFLKRLVEESGGTLQVVSHDAALSISHDGAMTRETGCWFPGTAIRASIRTSSTLTMEQLDPSRKSRSGRPYYWSAKGEELEDVVGDNPLWRHPHVDGSSVVRMSDYGTSLATRASGRKAREDIEVAMIFETRPVVLDFAGVTTVSNSFADECLGKLVSQYGLEELRHKASFEHISHDQALMVRLAIDRRVGDA